MTLAEADFVGVVVVFRVDASLSIGTGHVMRCLTLADAMRKRGAECHFLCRKHPGHLLETIDERGFHVHTLPTPSTAPVGKPTQLAHASWLGTSWQKDARQSGAWISRLSPDWLVLDHYALDERWEQAVLPAVCRLLVIDDLADRPHRADMLLDQNLGRQKEDYVPLVPAHCTLLIGPRYALLRPEFARWREASLARRGTPNLDQLLITMGGVDKDNATGRVLNALKCSDLPRECQITVVMGSSAPWFAQVREQAATMPWHTQVIVNITDMAERMASSDLAIGAAGSTSWERCCLGLPTLMVLLAENQRESAKALVDAGAATLVGEVAHIPANLPEILMKSILPESLAEHGRSASRITAGKGVDYVLSSIASLGEANER